MGKDVGWYDRQDPFSIDFWFYVGDAYENVPVLNHLAEQNSGRTGYRFTIDHGKLWVSLAHSPPANMIALQTTDALPVRAWTHIALTYDGSSRAAGMRLYLNGKPAPTEVKHDHLTRSILPWSSGDVFDPFLGLAFGTRFREKAPLGSAIDELRVYKRDLAPLEVAFLHDDAAAAAQPAELEPQLAQLLAAADAKVVAARAALTEARAAENELATAVPQVLVMGEAPEPIPTFVLNRGVYSAPGEQVTPRGLESVLPWDESLPQNRLGLAKWLFDPRNPLTARVFVNRVWQMHFGRGIVETAEDFGSQGSIPTHPALLDWLAVQFVESGWDVKALHRLIVTSATYRQSSEISAGAARARRAQRALRARLALADAGRDGARQRARRERLARREGRRREREAVSAARDLESAQQLLRLPAAGRRAGRRPASADALHVREAQRAASGAQDLRLHEPYRERRAPPQLEHAAPGAAPRERPAVRGSLSFAGRGGVEVVRRRARAAHSAVSARRAQHAGAGAARPARAASTPSSGECSRRTSRRPRACSTSAS